MSEIIRSIERLKTLLLTELQADRQALDRLRCECEDSRKLLGKERVRRNPLHLVRLKYRAARMAEEIAELSRRICKHEETAAAIQEHLAVVGADAETNYMPAKDCRNERITTAKQLKTLLGKGGIRNKHRGQHLYVHVGDWYKWNAEQARQEWQAADRAASAFASSAAEIRAEKVAKKSRRK